MDARVGLLLGTIGLLGMGQAPSLTVTLVGNAGVLVSDGTTSLLVDLPYESGAFGYMAYDAGAVDPPGDVVALITHHHRDHFDPALFVDREEWRLMAPGSVIGHVPQSRVVQGDSVSIGAFEVVAIPTPHTPDHRSYRIRWRGRVLHFVGDTEDPAHLEGGPVADVLFVTPWLSCAAGDRLLRAVARRAVAYHVDPGGGDRLCGNVDRMAQGASLVLQATGAGSPTPP